MPIMNNRKNGEEGRYSTLFSASLIKDLLGLAVLRPRCPRPLRTKDTSDNKVASLPLFCVLTQIFFFFNLWPREGCWSSYWTL